MDSNILILVAVRLKSSRLPLKALADLSGKPLIIRLTERVREAKIPSDVVWCTSTHPQDDPLEELANENNISIFRGLELDVMSRFIDVATQRDVSTVIRVTGDNPLTDPVMMDYMVQEHLAQNAEYTYTEDLPVGTRPEIINIKMLKRCHSLLQDPDFSEYMTWMLNRPDYFRTLKINSPLREMKRPEICLTVDTKEDLKKVQAIYRQFHGTPPVLGQIIGWLDKNSELASNKKSIPNSMGKNNYSINAKFIYD